jgi:hypothetical protein
MTLVPRRARKLEDQNKGAVENPPEDLQKFRNLPAWVLLGEPGAGKSTAFESEAEATDGKCLRIAEFIHADTDEAWNGKILFLDGLDETRASAGNDTAIQLIRKQLKRLGNPPFRIACRAADWYGATDAEDLKAASADGQLAVLQLEPLEGDDILTLLRDNHGTEDPRAFVEKAEKLGVAGLLDNPQTLGLLAEAIQGGHWPETRHDTYRLACKKLAEEANKRHRDQARTRPCSVESLLDAAGQLCAVLLLSDQTGIALDPDHADQRFVYLNACAPPDLDAAALAVRTKLFRPEGEERVVPCHRSVAEYLAARWLARRVDGAGLPLGRVLNLLLGQDGRTVAGLRGLYAWLALHSQKARPRLIEADPLTVVIYGDVKPMTVSDKRGLLAGLRRDAKRYSGFRWDVPASHPFCALADAELRDDFLATLQAPERDEASQAFVDCVLDILVEGEPLAELAPTLEEIVRDHTRWSVVRNDALKTWLKLANDLRAALTLLGDITAGRVADDDDELTGMLLQHLYPNHIGSEALLSHLHIPKNSNLIGMYFWFWSHELPQCAPDEHLPALLDGLVGRAEIQPHYDHDRSLKEIADKPLARGVMVYGDTISDERLFAWLGIGADEYGEIPRGKAAQETLSAWISVRPKHYKALLALCFSQCEGHEHPAYCVDTQSNRLHNATPPDDIGLWHLEQVDRITDDGLARVHLSKAVNALINQRGAVGLSLERLEAWANAHPERKSWLEPLLAWEIPEWHMERVAAKKSREQARFESKRNRTIALQRQLPQIQSGTARVDLMHQLAGVWMGLYTNTRGDTPVDRFESYCEHGQALLAMAEAGFRHCPERDDLPTVKEIIDLALEQKEHFIRRPCLVGMELRWRDGEAEIDKLPEEAQRRMLAFRLTDGTGNTPEWFIHLVQQRPSLVAEVLSLYAGTTLKAGKDYVDSIYPLEHDATYRDVAILAAPRLLETFPVRARSGQLHHLESLLKAALRCTPEQLPALVKKKLSMKGMDVAQKVYWLATAMLLDPTQYEAALWNHIGKSDVRANHLSGFLGNRNGGVSDDYALSVSTIGKLIEQLVPHAAIEWPEGGHVVSDAMRRGDHIRALVNRLGGLATPEAKQEIDRLLGLPALRKLKHLLEAARHDLKQRQRESEFRFPFPREVAQVLANQAPTSVADLAALTLDHLDDIAREIRQDNDDGFRAFWNVWIEARQQKIAAREENYCRDALLTRLRPRLEPLGIDSQPEGDYANDKRADLRLSYRTELALPIEIKRDSNASLWSALRKQLIGQYAIAPRANGYGIYLVLWFGGEGMPGAIDGGKKPQTPEELRTRLEAQLDPMERRRIFVRVLDVSWPK